MTGTPIWQAATTGQPPLAAHVNQFLGTHAVTNLYMGVQTASQTTAGTGGVSTNGLWIAQQFTTGAAQTALGYIGIQLSGPATTGANLGPLTVGIYANSAGAPTGVALISQVYTIEYVSAGPAYPILPLPVSALTPSTTYWIVSQPAGNVTYNYTWGKSNQTSGASTSTNGTTWSAQTYGLLFQVFDQTISGLLTCTWEDSGVRYTWIAYNANNLPSSYAEYTAGQTIPGYLQSFRNFTYSNGLLTGVS